MVDWLFPGVPWSGESDIIGPTAVVCTTAAIAENVFIEVVAGLLGVAVVAAGLMVVVITTGTTTQF